MEVSWPMVERENAFRQINAAVATSVADSRVTGVVISWRPSWGKRIRIRFWHR